MANSSLQVINTLTGTANQLDRTAGLNPIISIANNPIIPGTGSVTIPSGTTAQRVLNGIGSLRVNQDTGFAEISVDGVAWVDLAVGGGGVATVAGTLNRITSSGGANPIIDIAATYVGQASITTLGTITAGTWNASLIPLAFGGTNANLVASNGGIFYSTAAAGAILAGTATARQMLQSGAGAAPAWSTTTWPATSTINRILYSSAANVIGEIATANSATIRTDATGIPGFSGAMNDGAILIGATGGTPTVGTITAGAGITVTNGANSITISSGEASTNNAKNLIIGGNFDTNPWQAGTTFAAVSTGTYTADMWQWTQVGAGVVTISQVANAPAVADAEIFVQNCLDVNVTTADAAIAATDIYAIGQKIEGYNWAQIAQRIFTVSFWVRGTVTGIHCIYARNTGADRCYVAEYTINVADTWEYKTVTISASPSAGTWNYTNTVGIEIGFCLAGGANFQGANNTWNAANNYCTANQVNQMGTIGNRFRVQLVQVEPGSSASSFEILKESEVLAQCQRYFYKTFKPGTAPAQNVGVSTGEFVFIANAAGAAINVSPAINYPVTMRTDPNITLFNPAAANAQVRDRSAAVDCSASGTAFGASNSGNFGIQTTGNAGTAVGNILCVHLTASARLP